MLVCIRNPKETMVPKQELATFEWKQLYYELSHNNEKVCMIPGLTSTTFIMLVFGVSLFVVTLFLPSLLRSRKSRNGKSKAALKDCVAHRPQARLVVLDEMDDGVELDQALLKKVEDVISVLPNLET